jgi:hypothetical protein
MTGKDGALVRVGEHVREEQKDDCGFERVRPSATGPKSERTSRWKRITMTAGPLALAAAMLVYVTGERGPQGPELPPYSVTASSEHAMRGRTEASEHLHVAKGIGRDARFELLLRPATAPQGKVVAYAFTFAALGAEPVPLDAKVEIAPEGAVRLTGASRSLEGAREIRIVVGEPIAIGKFDDAAARAASSKSDARVRVLSVPIDRE